MEAFAARQLAKRRAKEAEGKFSKELEQEGLRKKLARKLELQRQAKEAVGKIDIKMTDLIRDSYQREYKAGRISKNITFRQQASLYALAAEEKDRMFKIELVKLEEEAKERELGIQHYTSLIYPLYTPYTPLYNTLLIHPYTIHSYTIELIQQEEQEKKQEESKKTVSYFELNKYNRKVYNTIHPLFTPYTPLIHPLYTPVGIRRGNDTGL